MIHRTILPLLLLLLPLYASSALREIDPAQQAPRLALSDAEGTTHGLQQYAGHVVLVNFWASWCTPCVRELPGLNRLRENYGNQPFEILGVNVAERPRRLTRFLRQHPIDFPVIYDRNSTAFDAWQVEVLPTSFLLDSKGRIRYRATGALEWDSEEMIGIIDDLLAEDQSPAAAP